ncbi:MAG: nicotinamide mononucleotide transporter [Clostridia bacterium]|nr:nicotinamide mononucleotide transporter [Clostridia bacterium]
MLKIKSYFSKAEILLWSASVALILISFFGFDRENYMTLVASLIGVTSLIFNAKGNPFGQLLMVIFSILYGVISFSFAYYGEMITYLGMSMPMAILALVSWLRHPYRGNRAEVEVNRLSRKEIVWLVPLSAAVTVAFYFILKAFDTANLIPSTLSVTTSFVAVYLTARRSPCFALAYAVNDVVLIVLWVMASLCDVRYLSVTVCFCAFLINDVYGFISWRRMQRRQMERK